MFNILNTIHPNYLQALITHANDQRNSVSNDAIAREVIEVSDDWWNALNSVPFVSCKYFLSLLWSYTSDYSFNPHNFPVQNVKAKRFTCWSKAQSPYRKSANGGKSVCLGRTSSFNRRMKRKSRKSQRLIWRCLNRNSSLISLRTRVVVRFKYLLASQMSLATSKTCQACKIGCAANLFDGPTWKPAWSSDGRRLGRIQRHYSVSLTFQTQQKPVSFLMFTLVNNLLLCYFDVQCQ